MPSITIKWNKKRNSLSQVNPIKDPNLNNNLADNLLTSRNSHSRLSVRQKMDPEVTSKASHKGTEVSNLRTELMGQIEEECL